MEGRAGEGDVLGGPDRLEHVEGLVEQVVALGVVDPECRVLALEVSGARREGETPARKEIEGRAGLGDDERVPVRKNHDVRDQPQRRGPGRRETHRHERVEGVVAAGLEPALRWRGMVGEAEAWNPADSPADATAMIPGPETSSGS